MRQVTDGGHGPVVFLRLHFDHPTPQPLGHGPHPVQRPPFGIGSGGEHVVCALKQVAVGTADPCLLRAGHGVPAYKVHPGGGDLFGGGHNCRLAAAHIRHNGSRP